jgi:hypothetical protein
MDFLVVLNLSHQCYVKVITNFKFGNFAVISKTTIGSIFES